MGKRQLEIPNSSSKMTKISAFGFSLLGVALTRVDAFFGGFGLTG
jgi:hypothetical protein